MSMYAPSQIPDPVQGEAAGLFLSEEEREKLQEIHELINRILRDLPVMARVTTQPYAMPPLPTVPYTYSVLQMPWGGLPYVASRVI